MNLSVPQTIIAGLAIVGVIVLGGLGTVHSDAVVAFLSVVVGNALGYVNGKKVAAKDAAHTATIVAANAAQTVATAATEVLHEAKKHETPTVIYPIRFDG